MARQLSIGLTGTHIYLVAYSTVSYAAARLAASADNVVTGLNVVAKYYNPGPGFQWLIDRQTEVTNAITAEYQNILSQVDLDITDIQLRFTNLSVTDDDTTSLCLVEALFSDPVVASDYGSLLSATTKWWEIALAALSGTTQNSIDPAKIQDFMDDFVRGQSSVKYALRLSLDVDGGAPSGVNSASSSYGSYFALLAENAEASSSTTNIKGTSADLVITIDADHGWPKLYYRFRWQKSAGGGSGNTSTLIWNKGDDPDIVHSLTGLEPNTEYYFQRSVKELSTDGYSYTDATFFTTGPLSIDSCDPEDGNQGAESLDIYLYGTGFDLVTIIDFGADISVDFIDHLDDTSMIATITIDVAASLGSRDVTVEDSLGNSETLTDGFTVIEPVVASGGSIVSLIASLGY